MKAFIWHKDHTAELTSKPDPSIIKPSDAIVKVTISTICTSDLHIIRGCVPRAISGTALGHEFCGEIIEIGSEVKKLKIGDRVSANCITFCGECFYCKRGYINNCERGGWELGCTIDGSQAQYVRVPYADTALTPLPDNVSYKNALFVGDILSSGYFGAQLCEIKREDTIAVIGSGPVGMCSMICAKLMGAKKIIALDVDDYRLKIAKSQGLCDFAINPKKVDAVELIKEITMGHGADSVIEAAGTKETFKLTWQIARANAIAAIVAMYEEEQILPLPKMYGKNLIFKTGGVDAIHCDKLVEFISGGNINTDFLITHTFPFSEIKKAYDVFENKKDNCLKATLIYQ